jgi:hypothetical protein
MSRLGSGNHKNSANLGSAVLVVSMAVNSTDAPVVNKVSSLSTSYHVEAVGVLSTQCTQVYTTFGTEVAAISLGTR